MKKCLSMLLVIAMLLSLAVPAMAAETITLTLSADKETVAPGESITLTVNLSADYAKLVCLQYHIYYNADLLEYDATNSKILTDNKYVELSTVKTDDLYGTHIRILGLDTDNVDLLDIKAGDIAQLVFTAKADVSGDAEFIFYEEAVAGDDFETKPSDAPVLVNNAADVKVGYTVTVSDSENGSVTADKEVAAANDTITLTSAPAEGYELDELTVTDASGAAVTVTDNQFTMPASNVTVAATFKAATTIPVSGITLDQETLSLTAGETGTLTATVTPETATDKTVTWYSSDESVATVADGAVTAVAAGTATITAKAGDVEATCAVTVTEKQEEIPAAGYSVTASEDVSITVGENAEVSITVTEADSKAYNAYELNITYPEGLTYVSASGSGVEGDSFQENHDGESRTIQIIGYGADKTSGTAAAKLTFTGSTAGEYDVTITSAKVDAAASAPTQDTPDATITDAATKITVTGYTVTLGDGLTADSTVATPGTDFTFKATDADNYDYTVTAKVGETKITVNDNKDGTYTIPADQITGNITVSAVMTAKTYDVTYDGTTNENAATYNTPYVFTPAKEGYTVGGVTVTIGGEAYTGYSNEDGTYTIPGDDITGDVVITVEWIEETPATVTVNKSEGVIGGDNATEGTDYTFSFGDTDNYEYDEETLVVKVGDTDITDKVTKNEETGVYTIPGDLITGDITISIERAEKVTFTVEVSEYLTLDEGNKMYLVTVKGIEDGKVAKYDGQNMFWSAQTLTTGEDGEETTGYGAYAWLVISNEGLEAVKTAASEKVTTAEGTSDLTVDYSGDVNGTEKVDVNDAQLVYNMYNAYYGDFTTVSMQKFLDADVNSDKTVNSQDAAAVVAIITGK